MSELQDTYGLLVPPRQYSTCFCNASWKNWWLHIWPIDSWPLQRKLTRLVLFEKDFVSISKIYYFIGVILHYYNIALLHVGMAPHSSEMSTDPNPCHRTVWGVLHRLWQVCPRKASILATGHWKRCLTRETSWRFTSTVGHYLLWVKTQSKASSGFVISTFFFFLIRLTGFAVDLREM